jgi:hypothetical protein
MGAGVVEGIFTDCEIAVELHVGLITKKDSISYIIDISILEL